VERAVAPSARQSAWVVSTGALAGAAMTVADRPLAAWAAEADD
jgi:hypothetical protein